MRIRSLASAVVLALLASSMPRTAGATTSIVPQAQGSTGWTMDFCKDSITTNLRQCFYLMDPATALPISPFQAGNNIGNTSFGISGTLPAFAATPAFTISGTLPAFAATPTVNLGTLNGAATAAGVAAVNTTLGTPMQNSGGSVTANAGTNLNTSALALDATVAGTVTSQGAATAGSKGQLGLGAVTTGAPAYTTGQNNPLSLDTAGNLRVNVIAGSASGNVGQASTTAGETGPMAQGAVTTAAPSYTTGQTSPLSLDPSGNLRVNVTTGGGTGGTSSTFGAAFPGPGTAIGAKNGANMVNLVADGSGNLDVNCIVGCAGGATSNASSAVATSGTNGATVAWLYLFNGTTWDQAQADGSKNLKVNVAAGSVTANAGTNLNTSLLALETGGNLATIAGAVTAGVQQENTKQINGVAPLMGNGISGTGSQRVNIASDNTAFTVNAAESGTWNITNITGAVSLPTGAATAANQTAFAGTTGTPSTSILTVQGNASGVPVPVSGSLSASINSFNAAVFGTPFTATTSGVTSGAFTSSTTVLVSNVGTLQPIYCRPDATTATASDQYISPGGGWFAFYAAGGITQVSCITAAGSSLVNITGGTGLPAGSNNPMYTNLLQGGVALGATNGIYTNLLQGNTVVSAGNPIFATLEGVVPLPTGASTAALQPTNAAQGSTTAGQTGNLVQGAVTTGAPSYTTGQTSPISLDAAGNLRVNIMAGAAAGGTSSNFAAAFPTAGTAIGAKNGANMVNLVADGSGNLDVNCIVGCAGGATSNATSAVATSSTNGATVAWLYLFNGTTWDQAQADGSKNLKVNVAAGSVTANAGTNLNTSLLALETGGNLATIAGAVTAAVEQTNEKQINGVAPLMGNGVSGTGSQRVNIASDNTAFSVNAIQSGTWTVQPGNTANTTAWKVDGSAVTQPISVADTVGTLGTLGSLNAVASVALNGQNGAGVFIAAGTLIGTVTAQVSYDGGTTWVTSGFYDAPTQTTSGPLVYGSANAATSKSIIVEGGVSNARVIVSAYTSGTANATMRATSVTTNWATVAQGSTTAAQIGYLSQAAVTTTPPAYTTGQTNPLSLTTAGALRVDASGTSIQGGTVGSANPGAGNQVMAGVSDSSGNVANPSLIGGNGSALLAQAGDTTTASTALGASAATISVPLGGERGASFQLQSGGTGVYTVTPKCSYDGGTSYNTSGYILDPISFAMSLTATIASAQAETDYQVLCPSGASNAQMKVSAYTSGTANWLARATSFSPISVMYGSDGTNIRAELTDTNGKQYALAQPTAAATGGATAGNEIAPNNTTGINLKASAGTVYGVQIGGIGSAPAYLKLYNKATAPTCGTDTPIKRLIIPAASTAALGAGSNISFPVGVAFSLGIGYCVTTGIADADTTAPAASTFLVNIDWN